MKSPTNVPSEPFGSSTFIAVIILSLLALFVGGKNLLDVLNLNYFHEEMRILYHYDSARVTENDYAGQYLSKMYRPPLYDLITQVALRADIDLVLFHRLLSVFCGLLLLAGAAVAGWRLGGVVPAAAVVVLIVVQPIYQFQTNSAVPHAFAFPLLMWCLVCLLYDRPYALAGLTVVSGLLYASITPILGLCLAWQLFFTRRFWSSSNSRRVPDLVILTLTAAVSLIVVRLQLLPISGYGDPIAIAAQADIYPENGPDGRHFYGVFKPLAYVFVSAYGQFRQFMAPELIVTLMFSFIGIAVFGLFSVRKDDVLFHRILSFIVPAALACIAVTVLRPHLSYRFALYPLFAVLPLLFVLGAMSLAQRIRAMRHIPLAAFVATVLTFALSMDSTSAVRNGFKIQMDEPAEKLIEFVRRLPKGTHLAAWPHGLRTDFIPYLTGKPLLVYAKSHYASYTKHVFNMRARMNDLIDAYLATDETPLVKLYCKWNVEYLVVKQKHFLVGEKAPSYFAPFGKRINQILEATKKSDMILFNAPAEAVVFEAGGILVVDLSMLAKNAGLAKDAGCAQ